MKVKIKLDGGMMPQKQHLDDAAFDLYVPDDVEITGWRQVVDLKFGMEIPSGYAATIQPRSGFSAKAAVMWADELIKELYDERPRRRRKNSDRD